MNDNSTPRPLSPKGARIRNKVSESRGSCFVVMGYNNCVLDSYYDEAIKPTVESLGYSCVRVDRQPYSDKISDQIRNGIDDCAVVIVDLTDDRPNCYFEAGYAVARDKVIIFQRLNSPPKYEAVTHFDVQEYPFILYGTLAELREKLRFRLKALRNET
jgi:hypothetical protein